MKTCINKDKFLDTKPQLYPADKKTKEEITNSLSYFLSDFRIKCANTIGNPGNKNNDSNSLNIVIELSDNNIYLLKKIPKKNIQIRSINQMTQLIYWCRTSGINIPKIYAATNKNFFIQKDNNFWILMEYIDGSFFSGEEDQLNETAFACGKLFKALSNLPKKLKPLKVKDPYFTNHEAEIFTNLKKCQPEWGRIFGDHFSSKLIKNWDYIDNQWKYLNSHRCISKPHNSIIHHDLHPHNFLFSQKTIYIIDYESIVIGPIQAAIGFAIIKLIKKICDTSSINITDKQVLNLSQDWISIINRNLPLQIEQNKIEIFGKAEIFRRFLSMSNKAMLNIPSVFNGPEVHLDSLFLADKIFVN